MKRQARDYSSEVNLRAAASVDEALSVADTWTPADAMMAAEEGRFTGAVVSVPELRTEVMVRHFGLMADFLTVGVSQVVQFERRSLILLRVCGSGTLRDVYGKTLKQSMMQEARLERRESREVGVMMRGRACMSLRELLYEHASDEENEVCEMDAVSVWTLRERNIGAVLQRVANQAARWCDFPKVLLAYIRRTKPELLAELGDSQVALSRRMGEQRATVSVREIEKIEKPMIALGYKGFHGVGGTKSEDHRKACQAAQMGNTNRAHGELKKAGLVDDEESEAGRNNLGALSRVMSAQRLRRLADEAEARRLVNLFGPGVAGCDPRKTVPGRE